MGRININTASKEMLIGELGLTEKVADRVVRMRKGAPFPNAEDLLEVEGIGEDTVSRLKDKVYFSESEEEKKIPKEEEKKEADGSGPTGSVSVDSDGNVTGTIVVPIDDLLDRLLKAFQKTTDKITGDDPYKKLADAWANWDALDDALSKKDCPEEVKKRLRDLLHNIRTSLRRLRNAVEAGNTEEAQQIAAVINMWAQEAKNLLGKCK